MIPTMYEVQVKFDCTVHFVTVLTVRFESTPKVETLETAVQNIHNLMELEGLQFLAISPVMASIQ